MCVTSGTSWSASKNDERSGYAADLVWQPRPSWQSIQLSGTSKNHGGGSVYLLCPEDEGIEPEPRYPQVVWQSISLNLPNNLDNAFRGGVDMT